MAQARNQPSYDFLAGSPSPQRPGGHQLRETLLRPRIPDPAQDSDGPKQHHNSSSGSNNEELRAQLNSLKYELESLKQERELTELRHEKELRDVQNKAEADFRRAQVSQHNRAHGAFRQLSLVST